MAVPSAFISRCAFAGWLNAGREPAAARDPAPLPEEELDPARDPAPLPEEERDPARDPAPLPDPARDPAPLPEEDGAGCGAAAFGGADFAELDDDDDEDDEDEGLELLTPTPGKSAAARYTQKAKTNRLRRGSPLNVCEVIASSVHPNLTKGQTPILGEPADALNIVM
ncbi:MAG TPA: hypothetical protein VHB47_21455 [Thermoanaerobaculia bacterium]|nr:hypothetical protein [Thermoanaerobaculia bacterium]